MIIVPLVLFLFVGFVIALYLFEDITWWKIIGFGYGLGVGAIGFEMFVFSVFHISWSFFLLLFPWMLLFLFKIPHLKTIKKQFGFAEINFDPLSVFFLLLVGLLIFFVIFEALLRPVSAWDAWSHWLLGANAFFYDARINPDFIKYANISYPPLVNLMGTFAYIVYGKIQDTWVLLLFTFFYISLIFLFCGYLKRHIPLPLGLGFTFLLASMQNFIRQAGRYEAGNGDIVLSWAFFASTMLLLDVFKKPTYRNAALLNIMIGIGALIKSEGLPFFFIIQVFLISYIFIKKRYKLFLTSLVGLFIILSWELFYSYFKLPHNPFLTGDIELVRLPKVFLNMLLIMFNFERWNFVWALVLLSLFFIKRKEEIILFSIVGIQLMVYLLIFLMTPSDPIAHLYNSFDRLLMHVAPIALFACAITIARLLPKRIAHFDGMKKKNN